MWFLWFCSRCSRGTNRWYCRGCCRKYGRRYDRITAEGTVILSFAASNAHRLFMCASQRHLQRQCCHGRSKYISKSINKSIPGRALCYTFANFMPTLLNALSIMILGRIYEKFARQLTTWENHRTQVDYLTDWLIDRQTDYNDALIVKLFVFQFANTYMSLFYLAFIRPEEHVGNCRVGLGYCRLKVL